MLTLRRLVTIIALFSISVAASARERPVLRVGSEFPLKSGVRPSAPVTRAVIGGLDSDDRRMLDECITTNKLKRGDYSALLRSVRIGPPRQALWFISPAESPYCRALYGAHLFRYFFVEEKISAVSRIYRVVFSNGGDFIEVYARKRNGLNDIQPTGCIAGKCWSARMAFDGRRYQPVRCTVTTFEKVGGITRPRPCTGMVAAYQPSGFDSSR